MKVAEPTTCPAVQAELTRRYPGDVPFDRITVEPGKMGGRPCIRGLRVPVATVVGMVAAGRTVEEIVRDLPYLEPEDVAESLRYAAATERDGELPIPGQP